MRRIIKMNKGFINAQKDLHDVLSISGIPLLMLKHKRPDRELPAKSSITTIFIIIHVQFKVLEISPTLTLIRAFTLPKLKQVNNNLSTMKLADF